jgi:hypothetical protein
MLSRGIGAALNSALVRITPVSLEEELGAFPAAETAN